MFPVCGFEASLSRCSQLAFMPGIFSHQPGSGYFSCVYPHRQVDAFLSRSKHSRISHAKLSPTSADHSPVYYTGIRSTTNSKRVTPTSPAIYKISPSDRIEPRNPSLPHVCAEIRFRSRAREPPIK